MLGLPVSATPGEIRAAYRRRAAELHPDRQPPDKKDWASEQMKQLNQARDTLLNPRPLRAWVRPAPGQRWRQNEPWIRRWWLPGVLVCFGFFCVNLLFLPLTLDLARQPGASEAVWTAAQQRFTVLLSAGFAILPPVVGVMLLVPLTAVLLSIWRRRKR